MVAVNYGAARVIGDPIELKYNERDLETCKHVVETYCRSKRIAVQAGGCYGVFPKWLSKKFDCVYTFEPSPELFNTLTINVPEHNVIKLQAAIGRDRKRMVRPVLALRAGKRVLHPGMTRVEANGGFIPTLRLDDLGVDSCDLLYLDIEGDELLALQGAQATIAAHRPVVVCEINSSLEERGYQRYDIFAYLRELGYIQTEMIHSDVVFIPQ